MSSSLSYRQSSAQAYRNQQVETASKEQLLIMLFDGAIRFLKVASKAMEAKDAEKTNTYLIKAQRIVTELMASLDVEQGGDVAKNLLALYEYFYHRLVKANLYKDQAMLKEVLDHMQELRKTWVDAIAIAQQEASGQIAPAPAASPRTEAAVNYRYSG